MAAGGPQMLATSNVCGVACLGGTAFQFAIRIDSFGKKNRPFDSLVVMQFFLLIYCIVSVKKYTTMHAVESYSV